jgi:hypothetical protein
MDTALTKALVSLIPISMLFVRAEVYFVRAKSMWALLQLVGSAGLLGVVLAHICEAIHLFPWMHWDWSTAPVTILTSRALSSD